MLTAANLVSRVSVIGATAARAELSAMGGAVAKAESGMGRLSGAAGGLGSALGHAKKSVSGLLSGPVGMIGLGVGAVGLAGALTTSINSARDFQAAMELIKTQAGGTQAEVDSMSKSILGMAGSVGTAPLTLAEGLYHIESAGIRGAKALDILKTAAMGAKVGGADLESTTNALIAAVNSGIPGVQSMAGAMGTLNAIVGSGNMRMGDLTAAMTTGVLSVAKTFGVTLQGFGAALAAMTNQGIPAEKAATALKMAIVLMGAPTAKAAKELKSIGLSSSQLATDMRSSGGLITAMQDLKTHMDKAGLSSTQQAALIAHAFGGGKTGPAIMALIGNIDKLKAAQDAVTAGAGSFGDAWAAQQKTAQAHWDEFNAAISTLGVNIGTVVLPLITDAMGQLGDWLTKNQGNITGMVTGMAGALRQVGAVVGPAIATISSAWAAIPDDVKKLIIGAFLVNKTVKWLFGIDASSIVKAGISLGASFLGSVGGKLAGALAGDAASKAVPQDVFVVNWAMMSGGGGAVGAAEGAAGAVEGGAGVGLAATAGTLAAGIGAILAAYWLPQILAAGDKGKGAQGTQVTGSKGQNEGSLSWQQVGLTGLQNLMPPSQAPVVSGLTAVHGAVVDGSTHTLGQLAAIQSAITGPSLEKLSEIKGSTDGLAPRITGPLGGSMDEVRSAIAGTTGAVSTGTSVSRAILAKKLSANVDVNVRPASTGFYIDGRKMANALITYFPHGTQRPGLA